MSDVRLLECAAATVEAGRQLATAVHSSGIDRAVIYLRGDLGAGKTTFARGFLAGCGHAGRVPSPTYTLIELYEFEDFTVYHIDLYRLAEPTEVDDLGLAELDTSASIMLIEWPERAAGRLPPADLEVTLALDPAGRRLCRDSRNPVGVGLLAHRTV